MRSVSWKYYNELESIEYDAMKIKESDFKKGCLKSRVILS